jgi:hypothetical protein
MSNLNYAAYSAAEYERGKNEGVESGYWSNEIGWGSLTNATIFTEEEKNRLRLPTVGDGTVEWLPVPFEASKKKTTTPVLAEEQTAKTFNNVYVLCNRERIRSIDGFAFYHKPNRWQKLDNARLFTEQEKQDFALACPNYIKDNGLEWLTISQAIKLMLQEARGQLNNLP